MGSYDHRRREFGWGTTQVPSAMTADTVYRSEHGRKARWAASNPPPIQHDQTTTPIRSSSFHPFPPRSGHDDRRGNPQVWMDLWTDQGAQGRRPT